MKNSLTKMAELADRFEHKVAQYTHQNPTDEMNPTTQQVQDRLVQANLEASLAKIKQSVMEFLALKNDTDMQLTGQFLPQSKSLSVRVTFPNALRSHIEGRVAENRKSFPAFSLPGFITQEVSKANSNLPTRVENISFA